MVDSFLQDALRSAVAYEVVLPFAIARVEDATALFFHCFLDLKNISSSVVGISICCRSALKKGYNENGR